MNRKPTEHTNRTHSGTQKGTHGNSGHRKKPLPLIYSSERLNERLYQILYGSEPEYADCVVNVYRATEDRYRSGPMLFKCLAHPHLEQVLRDDYGGGRFAIYIRDPKTLLLAGIIDIGRPLKGNWLK